MNKASKYIQMILLVLIVVIAIGAYRLGYVEYIEKAEQVKKETKAINAQITALEEKETHRSEFEEAIAQADKNIEDIIGKYSTGNSPEKSIVFIAETEEKTNTSVSSISMGDDTVFGIIPDLRGNDSEGFTAVKSQLNINFSTDYDGFKALVDRINNYSERMNINTFTASYDLEKMQVYGTMAINLYAIKGNGREYKAPFVSGIATGTDNIFE